MLADTLSRAYLGRQCENAAIYDIRNFGKINAVPNGILPNASFKDRLVDITNKDPGMMALREYIVNGWPAAKRSCLNQIKPF